MGITIEHLQNVYALIATTPVVYTLVSTYTFHESLGILMSNVGGDMRQLQ